MIIGNKLENQYYYGKNYMELVINISSSKVAASITHICTGTLKNMIVDLGFLIEAGHEPEFENELPERMLGCVRFKNCDLKGALLRCCLYVVEICFLFFFPFFRRVLSTD